MVPLPRRALRLSRATVRAVTPTVLAAAVVAVRFTNTIDDDVTAIVCGLAVTLAALWAVLPPRRMA